jgi:periplasmic protein TonB
MDNKSSRGGGFVIIGVVVAAVSLVSLLVYAMSGTSEAPRKVVPVTTVKITLPPPPPPPPPKEPPPPTPQKMVEMPHVQEMLKVMPQAPSPRPSDAPPGPPDLGLAQGAGPGDFGPSGSGGGGGGGGSLAGWYGSLIGAALYDAVSKDGRLEHANGEIRARIWIGPDGIPTRVELVNKLGDPKLNQAFEDIVLHELRPSDPPPKELPQPVVVRLRAQPPTRS